MNMWTMNKIVLFLSVVAMVVYVRRVDAVIENRELDTMTVQHNGSSQSALYVDWERVPDFHPDEFQGQLHLLDKEVVYVLQALRDIIGRIKISPVLGAIARTDKAAIHSMHYAGDGRLSRAVDIMPMDVTLKQAYEAAKMINKIGGIGVYPDWKPRAGLHIDLRKRKVNYQVAQWSGVKNEAGLQVYGAVGEAFV